MLPLQKREVVVDYCKFCSSVSLVKNGFNEGAQRYKCKDCGRNMRQGDGRVRYSHEQKMKVIRMVLEGVRIRSIACLEGISAPLILHWMREASGLIQAKLAQARAV
jgi:transposase-like protein